MHDFPQKAPPQAIIQLAIKPKISSIVKIPPKKADVAYSELVCTPEDKAIVFQIITTLGENGKVWLLFNQSELKELGELINHLHPLKFLTSIFTVPRLKECMVKIFDDYFKRNGFMEGLAPNLTKEAEKGKLDQYIGDFALEVQVPAEEIRPYFLQGDWVGLVERLINS